MIEQNHEYYVSLEVAKLLEEAGFDWGCKKIHFKTGYKGNDDVWELEDNYKNTKRVLELLPTCTNSRCSTTMVKGSEGYTYMCKTKRSIYQL